jgi:hypothetical protein
VRMPDVRPRPAGRQRGYPRIHPAPGNLWTTTDPMRRSVLRRRSRG